MVECSVVPSTHRSSPSTLNRIHWSMLCPEDSLEWEPESIPPYAGREKILDGDDAVVKHQPPFSNRSDIGDGASVFHRTLYNYCVTEVIVSSVTSSAPLAPFPISTLRSAFILNSFFCFASARKIDLLPLWLPHDWTVKHNYTWPITWSLLSVALQHQVLRDRRVGFPRVQKWKSFFFIMLRSLAGVRSWGVHNKVGGIALHCITYLILIIPDRGLVLPTASSTRSAHGGEQEGRQGPEAQQGRGTITGPID